MKNFLFSLFFFGIVIIPGFSQDFSARLLDLDTKRPVPYATIQYGAHKGTISNDEGVFAINASAEKFEKIVITSMGYEPREIMASEFTKADIFLKPQVIQLDDVFLSDKKLSGREILERAKEKVKENYDFELSKKRFFFRESSLNRVKRFDMNIKKSSIADISQELMDSISESIPKNSDSYKEVLGDFYGNYSDQKITILKAANLYNPQSTASLDKLTARLNDIFKANVKKNSYLKVKSGIFGVKVDPEEVQDEIKEEKEAENKQPTPEEIEKSELAKRDDLKSATVNGIKSVMKNMFWKEEGIFDLFDKLNRYKYKVEGYTYLDQEIVYVIEFAPKRAADFRGKIYVNTSDFGVHRIDFSNVKPLKKFRLLGISAIDDVYRGKMIFSKNENGKYVPRYIEKETGESFGIDRPLTLIEKNKNVIGRRKQNELDMDILINVGQLNKYQFVVYDSEALSKSDFELQEAGKEFDYKTFKKYDPAFWEGYNTIEPNAAIKEFTAIEK